jgi:hypothetical protein
MRSSSYPQIGPQISASSPPKENISRELRLWGIFSIPGDLADCRDFSAKAVLERAPAELFNSGTRNGNDFVPVRARSTNNFAFCEPKRHFL